MKTATKYTIISIMSRSLPHFSFLYIKNLHCISIPQDIQKISTVEELERFILEHGEQVVDVLGSEVDRIEQEIKVQPIHTLSALPKVGALRVRNSFM